MRAALNLLHRWFGLAIAGFLFVSGLTGAVISWDHELDEVLNPHLTDVDSVGPAISPLELAAKVEAEDPRARVSWITLAAEPGHALSLFVVPRRDATTGRLFELGYNQVFLDPVTGAENGRRDWGAAWPITTETFVSFLYVLHYSLHIPEFWGIDLWGMWLLGIVAMVWAVDCFIGFYLTLPTARPPDPDRPAASLSQFYREFYAGSPFVRVVDEPPNVIDVRGTNNADLYVRDEAGLTLVISSIDNLVRGAAGQAVQCMNLGFGLPEDRGLRLPALVP